jgi:hypothetical protein
VRYHYRFPGGDLSPILVRPVREQLEHDRIIRLLQAKLKRKHEVAVNIADEQTAGVKIGLTQMFPDLVLTSQDKGHRLEGVIEVETGESVNHLEAMAQWAHFGRVRAPFHLYVPATAVDIARRLCVENGVAVAEVWSYHSLGDQTRFTMVHRNTTKDTKATKETKEREARERETKDSGEAGRAAPEKPARPRAAKAKPAKAKPAKAKTAKPSRTAKAAKKKPKGR